MLHSLYPVSANTPTPTTSPIPTPTPSPPPTPTPSPSPTPTFSPSPSPSPQPIQITTCLAQNPTFVFYNRVPKTGSSTFQSITANLLKLHNFIYFQSSVSHSAGDIHGAFAEIRTTWTTSRTTNSSMLFDKHQYFIEPDVYPAFNLPSPSTHINIIREPVARVLSYYDYLRWGPRPGYLAQALLKLPFASRTFEECVEAYRTNTSVAFVQDCMGINEQMRYFCGVDPICYTNSPAALELAKKHLLEHYAFVGLSERFEETLLLAEKILPGFFQGSLDIYEHLPLERVNNAKKSHPSEEILQYWRDKNQLDMQFYDFAKDVFDMRLQACNLTLPITQNMR
eukprot:TRINITY_DN15666_c0_g1::TRINITY_DN15666_c0_g1_i1::g.18789::m.18789 TRINITY_DN15666_c0_g1::TRINITY_DN15666_c0_g1_i1::g.18789  ORF type:complete len:339 (-),score=15.28,sp/O17645/HST2_CAEEL/31.72/2e-24,Sulfotransfer_2/PF03567.9/1.8e-14,DEC-1_N/PF04625.8/5.5,Trypan_PARP/PF05887.6/11 TRINITY_DN15666_c0_g1_i1:164-1180(-)